MYPEELTHIDVGCMPEDICKEIIDAAEAHGEWIRSGNVGFLENGYVGDLRTSSETWVERHNPLVWIRDVYLAHLTRALDKLGHEDRRYFYESRVVRYNEGEYLREHHDNPTVVSFEHNQEHGAHPGFYHKGRRKLYTSIIYLNDDFEGGELHFVGSGQSYKPSRGDLVLFPPFHLHEAKDVDSGTKYILTNAVFAEP